MHLSTKLGIERSTVDRDGRSYRIACSHVEQSGDNASPPCSDAGTKGPADPSTIS